jgi:hypothetical protein
VKTPNLQLPEVPKAIYSASDEINAGFRMLDAIVHLAVIDKDLNSPPNDAEQGDRYIVPVGAIGDWTGWDRSVAVRLASSWRRIVPRPGWRARVLDESAWYLYTGTEWEPEVSGGSGSAGIDPLEGYEHFSDMDFGSTTATSATSSVYRMAVSAGTVASVAGESGRPGIMRVQKLNSSSGQANLFLDSMAIVLGDGETTFECDVRMDLAQATASGENGAALRIGFLDGINNDPNNGVYFSCFPSINSGRWQLRTEASNTVTSLDTSFAHAANTWFRVKIVVNAAGSSVEGFIDGASVGSIATNIPVGTALTWRWQVWQASGFATGVMSMDIDWVRVRKIFTTPRS